VTFLRFAAECFRRAFRGGWAVAETASFVVSLAGGIFVSCWPDVFPGAINLLMWAIPLAIFFGILFVGWFVAAYRFHRELEQAREQDRVSFEKKHVALETQLAAASRKQTERLALNQHISAGNRVMQDLRQWGDEEQANKLREAVNDWTGTVVSYLREHLPTYEALFLSDAGFGVQPVARGNKMYAQLNAYMDRRLARLVEILHNLPDKL
jgi:hypothetical protein